MVAFTLDSAFDSVQHRYDLLALAFAITQCLQRIQRFAGLGNEQCCAAFRHGRLAVAEFGRDIRLDRQARDLLQPVFGDHTRIKCRAAGRNGDARRFGDVRNVTGQGDVAGGGVDEGVQRLANNSGLFVDFFQHEMAVFAFAHQCAGLGGHADFTLHLVAVHVADGGAFAADLDAVAVFKEADFVGQRGEGVGIGRKEHFPLAETNSQRRAETRANHQVFVAGENHGQRKRAAQALQRSINSVLRRHALADVIGHQMRDDFGIGVGFKTELGFFQLFFQFLIILDNAVMNDGYAVGDVGVGVFLDRAAMGCPARMADADAAAEGLFFKFFGKVDKLAFCAAALQLAALQRGDARAVIAAVFKAFQPLDQKRRDVFVLADNAYDTTHNFLSFPVKGGCFLLLRNKTTLGGIRLPVSSLVSVCRSGSLLLHKKSGKNHRLKSIAPRALGEVRLKIPVVRPICQ